MSDIHDLHLHAVHHATDALAPKLRCLRLVFAMHCVPACIVSLVVAFSVWIATSHEAQLC